MAEVKWIKIVTDIFDDEKILMIEAMPDADSIIVIWFKLLCLAGKQNNSGVFTLHGRIAYTDEMFAAVFRRPINTVRLALKTFEAYGMIEIINDTVTIPNWEKHQTLDAYEHKKERDRLRMQQKRAEQRRIAGQVAGESPNSRATVARPVDDPSLDVAPLEEEKEREGEKKKNRDTCTEQSSDRSAPSEGLHLFSLPLNDGTYFGITQEDIDGYKSLYPAVDVEQEIRKMIGWLNANPAKRKTRRGIKNFVNSWLSREQDKGGPNRPVYSAPQEKPKPPQQPMNGNPWKR